MTGIVLCLAVALPLAHAAAAAPPLSLVTDPHPGPAARHGLRQLRLALEQRKLAGEETASVERARGKILLVAGLARGAGAAAALHRSLPMPAPAGPESLCVRHLNTRGKKALLVSGGDDRGLMYALLDVADRIGWAADPAHPLSEVRDTTEQPAVAERALSIYTMHRGHFESFFFDENYWRRYLDLLARNRFNSFALLFAYEAAGYFAPAYPYFFDVQGFPEIRVVDLTREQQQRNLAALRRLIRMAHERGLNFTVGLWDHIYRGGVQGPTQYAKKPTPGLVWGLHDKNLTPYITAALTQFLKLLPEVDGIQFRMHGESGLRPAEMKQFWESLYQVMQQHGGRTRFTFRIKEFPDDLIDRAVELGLNFRLATKYWAEQMGLPFHPTHINRQNQFDRRHSYADVLRYPQRYQLHWRLWNGGTSRILLWGDPDYARRFAASTHLYDGEGFEVNEPLATKMAGQPHDLPPFQLLRPQYRYYDYEFERYWHFFQVFGRLGYNPATPAEVWQKEFEKRFGREAAPYVEQALHRASQVLPRIIAYCFPYNRFPTTRGWVEKQRLEDLSVYARAEPSDTEQFQSFDEAALGLLEGSESAKIHPLQTSRWFAATSAAVFSLAAEAEKRAGAHRNQEFISTLVDLRILANLALYHSRRIHAGLSLALFNRTRDRKDLDQAITHERSAIAAWQALVEAAGDVYHDNLRMGQASAGLSGHWKDELLALEKGLAELERQRAASPARTGPAISRVPVTAAADREPPVVRHTPVATAPVSKPLAVTARVEDPSGVKWVSLRYRAVNQHQDFRTLPMLPTGAGNEFSAEIPAAHIDPKFDLMYLIEVMDRAGNGRIYPDLETETPYVIVKLER